MKRLWIALAVLALAGGVLAQEPAAPLGQFFGPLVKGDGVAKLFRLNNQPGSAPVVSLRRAPSRWAVPLIPMKAPKATDPAMQFAPRMDKVEPMPQAQLPPACELPLVR
jgi:hypothetical protein